MGGVILIIIVAPLYVLVLSLGILLEIVLLIYVLLDVVLQRMLTTIQELGLVSQFVQELIMQLEYLPQDLMIVLEIIALSLAFCIVWAQVLGQIGRLIDAKQDVLEITHLGFQLIHKMLEEDVQLLYGVLNHQISFLGTIIQGHVLLNVISIQLM